MTHTDTIATGVLASCGLVLLVRWLWNGAKREDFNDADAIELARARRIALDAERKKAAAHIREITKPIAKGRNAHHGGNTPAA